MHFIEEIKIRELPLGVASNSEALYVDQVLRAIDVGDTFDCVITPDQVAQPKPAPDIYLAAAVSLNTPPERCLAIEDTPIGLSSALSAGMRCVVIPSLHLEGADFTGAYASFTSFPALLRELDSVLA
jgi:HAD superfamily hydrolase (TIGR01509 family)